MYLALWSVVTAVGGQLAPQAAALLINLFFIYTRQKIEEKVTFAQTSANPFKSEGNDVRLFAMAPAKEV